MKYNWFVFFLIILSFGCNNQQEELLCYHAVKDDFTEKVMVNGTIKAKQTTYIKAPPGLGPVVDWVEQDGIYVEKGDTVCLMENPEVQSTLEKVKNELEAMKADLDKMEADHLLKMAMFQADMENNEIQLSITSLDSLQKSFAPPLQKKIIALQQEKAHILKRKLEKNIAAQKTIGESEIKSLTFRIGQKERRIQRIQDMLDELVITTPKSGLLMLSENPELHFFFGDGMSTLGGKVEKGATTYTGMNIAEIPELDKMQILAELSEIKYKKTLPGQHVIIHVDAKNNLITTGKVLRKMLSGKSHNRESKVKFYEALIEVDSCHSRLTPGLNAKCEIIISEYKDTLAVPAVSVFEDNDKEYVYVLKNNKYVKTFVTTGNSTDSHHIIKSGLKENSYIAFSKPPADKIIRDRKTGIKKAGFDEDTIKKDTIPEKDTTQLKQLTTIQGYEKR